MDASRLPAVIHASARSRSPSPCRDRVFYGSTPPPHIGTQRCVPPPNQHSEQHGVRHGPGGGHHSRPRVVVDTAEGERRSVHSTGSYRVDESEDELDTYYQRRAAGHVQAHHNQASEREDVMRRRLKFFFMNPCEKWRARKRFPWKMLIQFVKIILVTIQLTMFGTSRSSHVGFEELTATAFRHLYLKDWSAAFETMPYPPSSGPFAVYTIPHFYESVNWALHHYNITENEAIGTYHFSWKNDSMPPMEMCVKSYKTGEIFAFNQTYYFDSSTVRHCFKIEPVDDEYDIERFLEETNRTINFDTLIYVNLKFSLKSVHLKGLTKASQPDCFIFYIKINYDNSQHNGQMIISLSADEMALKCDGHVKYPSNDKITKNLTSAYDTVVIVIVLISIVLCGRSIYRAQSLQLETKKYFKKYLAKDLTWSDKLEFVDGWYVLIIITDCLVILGSIIKIQIENKISDSYEVCGIMLGTANLLVWFGVLRYLGFFHKYNILILTLKRSAPNILRFLCCAGVFYLGFVFCGWVILGPYHIKFRELGTTSECLFSLVNGDDMFVTFAAIGDKNQWIWWYSRIYLYSFISLFIYVVLSVFISVIMDTYETIKYYYAHGFPKSTLQEFVDACPDDADSPLYLTDEIHLDNANGERCCLFSCCRRQRRPSDSLSESSSLLHSHIHQHERTNSMHDPI